MWLWLRSLAGNGPISLMRGCDCGLIAHAEARTDLDDALLPSSSSSSGGAASSSFRVDLDKTYRGVQNSVLGSVLGKFGG